MAYNLRPFIASSNDKAHVVRDLMGYKIENKIAKANKNSHFVLEKFSRVSLL